MTGIIYKATNIITNKCYIGQTVQKLNHRKNGHLSNKNDINCYFHKAIRKYGIDNFKWEIICECSSKEELNEKEKYYIKSYNTIRPNGYNLTEGGEGSVGYKHTDETKKKMSELKCGKYDGENNPCYNSRGIKSPLSKKYELTNIKTGEVILIIGLIDYCKKNNLDLRHLYHIMEGKRKSHKGFTIRIIEEDDVK